MADNFTFNQWPYMLWKVQRLFKVKQLKSPSFAVQNFDFHLTLEQNCYEDASKDCFEIYLVDRNTQSKENNNIVVNTYIRDKYEKIRFTQTTLIKRSENLPYYTLWSLKKWILVEKYDDIISAKEDSLTFVCMFGPESAREEEINKKSEGKWNMSLIPNAFITFIHNCTLDF